MARSEWDRKWWGALRHICMIEERPDFTSEDITELCGQPPDRNARHVGANTNAANAMGFTREIVDRPAKAKRPNQNGTTIKRWEWTGKRDGWGEYIDPDTTKVGPEQMEMF